MQFKSTTRMISLLGCTMAMACGYADPSDPDEVTDAVDSPIIGGTTDNADPSIVAIFAHPANSSSGSLCTGTVVSSRAVLTAAHCVDPRVIGSGNVFDVYTGTNLGSSTTRLRVSAAAFDSQFDPNQLEKGHDVAVLTLKQATSLTPVPFNQAPLTDANLRVPVRLVGYGVSTHQATGAGTKRSVTTSVDYFDNALVEIGSSSQQTCHGDSGGPALQVINGVETVIGVTSFGMDKSATNVCFGGGYDTRVDTYRDFVNAHL
jgi:secreted trypsin-like serine protease